MSELQGLIRVCPENPRYFTDDTGKAIYCAGAHTWNNLVDMDVTRPPKRFNFEAYLDYLEKYGHNFFRLWAWELPQTECPRYPFRRQMGPIPFERTGPGTDPTGLPRFDLTKLNQAYFDRVGERVRLAGDRGMIVAVMLFEGWSPQFVPDITPHPFYEGSNVNGVSYGDDPSSMHSLEHPAITAVQESYVRKVIESVNDLDNVVYEIANEAGDYSTAWQHHMIRFIRDTEATMSKQHLVGMSFQVKGGNNQTLFDSNADWISPNAGEDRVYFTDPPAADGSKVIVADTDHLGASGSGDRPWVWKSFTRGLNTLLMDRYVLPDSVTDEPYEKGEEIRVAMGHTRSYSRRMNMNRAVPRSDLASSTFCIADVGESYLVYVPDGGDVEVHLEGTSSTLAVEWFDPSEDRTRSAETVEGGNRTCFKSPFNEEAVLFIKDGGK